MSKEKTAQQADGKNPPAVNVNFAGTGFVSLIDKDGNAVKQTEVVCNTVTKEILWQLNHGKQPEAGFNPFDIQQMFTHCALGDGNGDGELFPNSQIKEYFPRQGIDTARKTTLDMFHLDNIKTKFQDEYYTAAGFCGCDDCWNKTSRNYTFKFRRSYKFNLVKGVDKFICREIGLFAQPSDQPRRGNYRGWQTWLEGKASGEFGYPTPGGIDSDRPSAGNPFGYPFDMTARLVLPTPLVVDLSQAVVVTYDFTMSIDCNAKDVAIRTRNTRTGDLSGELRAKIGFDFKCDRTAFGGYRTLPPPNSPSEAAPGVLWNTVQNSGSMTNFSAGSVKENSEESGNSKGFLSGDAGFSRLCGRYRTDYQHHVKTGDKEFAESEMKENNPGTVIPPGEGGGSIYSIVKTNHAKFQTTYVYEIRLPYRASSEQTLYPNEFNIGGIRLWFEPVQYPNQEWHSPIEWRPGRQFFVSVAVTMSFRNMLDDGTELSPDRDIMETDWGYSPHEIGSLVYDQPSGEIYGPEVQPVQNPEPGQKGYFLRQWGGRFAYYPVYWRLFGGGYRWVADDDMPTDGTVVYHGYDRNFSSPAHKKPFKRGFMLDDRDGSVYMCLLAHFANSQAGLNEYRWVHAEPFRLRQICRKPGGEHYGEKQPVGVPTEYSSEEGLAVNEFGDEALTDSHGFGMAFEQAFGRLYSQREMVNGTPDGELPLFIEEPSDWKDYLNLQPVRGLAPEGWHVPTDAELCAFFHGQAKGTKLDGTGDPGDGVSDVRKLFMFEGDNPFGFNWRFGKARIGGEWFSSLLNIGSCSVRAESETEPKGGSCHCFVGDLNNLSLIAKELGREIHGEGSRLTLICFKN
jgi:hypothetical protein